MSWKLVAFWVLILVLDRWLKKKHPRFYQRLELPANVILTILLVGYSALLGYAACDVLMSEVSTGDKVVFAVFMGLMIAVNLVLILLSWKEWAKKRRKMKALPDWKGGSPC